MGVSMFQSKKPQTELKFIEEHPKVVEYGVPALTFVAGLFTGKKVEQANDNMYGQRPVPPQPQEEIDFDKIPD